MKSKKINLVGLLTLIFCLNLISSVDLSAQNLKQKARDKARLEAEMKASEKEEVKELTVEEKKAKNAEMRAERMELRKKANERQNRRKADANKVMFKKLEMTDDQIKKYEKMSKDYSDATAEALKRNTGDQVGLQADMQKISAAKNAALKTIFKGDQFKQYEIYKEDDAINRTDKKYKHKVKNLPNGK